MAHKLTNVGASKPFTGVISSSKNVKVPQESPLLTFLNTHAKTPMTEWTQKDIERFDEIVDVTSDKDPFSKTLIEMALASQGCAKGINQLNAYTAQNFSDGLLEMMERYKRNIGCATAEQAVTFLSIMGYSLSRICFQMFCMGFRTVTNHTVRNYLKQNRTTIDRERRNFMSELTALQDGIWQDHRAKFLSSEKKMMVKMYDDIEELQERFMSLSPVDNEEEYQKILKTLEELHEKIGKMNGIPAMRRLSMKIAEVRAAEEIKRANAQGYNDGRLKKAADVEAQKQGELMREEGGPVDIEASVTMMDEISQKKEGE